MEHICRSWNPPDPFAREGSDDPCGCVRSGHLATQCQGGSW